jgi:CRISPR-associated protein Csb2
MASFSLVIEYLTGYAVATDPSSRDRPEWPPHPARVFMALAAAHFETNGAGKDKVQEDAERGALEWIAQRDPPDLVIPNHTAREVLTVYVPVNDMSVPSLKTIAGWDPSSENGAKAIREAMAVLPTHRSNKQPRTFPRVHVGNQPVRLIYRIDPELFPQHIRALEGLCRHVTRIGHSSSLVWMWLERNGAADATHVHDESGSGDRYRTPFGSMCQTLEDLYGEKARERHAAEIAQAKKDLEHIKKQIATLKKRAGNEAALDKLDENKKRLEQNAERELPPPIRPVISHTASYRPVAAEPTSPHRSTFDPNFIVLRPDDEMNQTFGLESTARLTEALRGTILSTFGDRPIPTWISGHDHTNGEKLKSGSHLALVPLPFVGSEHADGHLLGMAIMIPTDVPLIERGKALSALLFTPEGEPKPISLKLGSLGTWTLVRDASIGGKFNLRTSTYTQASIMWASVTPIVLDRMPKSDRVKEPLAWRHEVAGIIAGSCVNVGLPEPVAVRVEKTPFFRGSLRAMPGQGGFPQLRKDKFQVHAQIDFDRPVPGPVLIGAGRFRGYGLMRPWKEGSR